MTQLLAQLDGTNRAIAELEERMREVSSQTPTVQLLQTIPGIGPILSHVIAYEIGDIMRFASARHLAEAAYWVITTKSPYKEPQHARVNTVVSSKKG